jgi:hypothetical protein
MLTHLAIGVTDDASGLQRAVTASVAVSKIDRAREPLRRRLRSKTPSDRTQRFFGKAPV